MTINYNRMTIKLNKELLYYCIFDLFYNSINMEHLVLKIKMLHHHYLQYYFCENTALLFVNIIKHLIHIEKGNTRIRLDRFITAG